MAADKHRAAPRCVTVPDGAVDEGQAGGVHAHCSRSVTRQNGSREHDDAFDDRERTFRDRRAQGFARVNWHCLNDDV
eukprot:1611001-Prymnesium_polylepis.2